MPEPTHRLIFGFYKDGNLVTALNTVTCTHRQAALIIGLLDTISAGNPELAGGYFACDYV